MTGHLMQTVNPEAVSEDHEVPPVGARVQFFARPGMGRGGHNIFPADVMHADPKTGAVSLWVLYGREDWREHNHVHRRSDQEPYNCWDYLPDGYDELADELDKTKARLAELETAIFGDYNRPQKSIVEFLVEFEQRVFAAEGKKPKK